MSSKIRIGVFGVGAIGTVVSFGLKDIYDIFYFNRSSRSQVGIDYNGELISKDIQLEDLNRNLIEYDWLIVCIKEYHNNDAIPFIKKQLSANTKVAIIRNGLHLKEPFLAFLDENHIIECIIDCPTEELSKGHYVQHKAGKIYTQETALTKEFSSFFLNDRIVVETVNDFHSYKWKKLIESSSIGAIQTMLGNTCKLFREEKNLDLYKQIMKEGIAVAISDDAQIGNEFYEEQLRKLMAYPESKGSSMLSDLLRGRPIEWKAKNGIISKIGKQNEINTEVNDLLCLALKNINC